MESGEKGRATPWEPEWLRTPAEVKVCDGLEAVAKEVGAKSISSGEYNTFLELFQKKNT
jgi:hypothetical protein